MIRCWAFTTVALIESGYLIHHNQEIILSEQQLVDCTNSNCQGIYIDKALQYVQAYGLECNDEYPYQARFLACKNDPSKSHAHISGFGSLGRGVGHNCPATDDEIKTALINNGPIGFMLDASGNDFMLYR